MESEDESSFVSVLLYGAVAAAIVFVGRYSHLFFNDFSWKSGNMYIILEVCNLYPIPGDSSKEPSSTNE